MAKAHKNAAVATDLWWPLGRMGTYGGLWGSGVVWGSMGSYGDLWGLRGWMGTCGDFWALWRDIRAYGDLWGPMRVYGIARAFVKPQVAALAMVMADEIRMLQVRIAPLRNPPVRALIVNELQHLVHAQPTWCGKGETGRLATVSCEHQ